MPLRNSFRPLRRSAQGHTLVELLIGLAVLAILASAAAPSVARAARSYSAWSAGRELRADLALARSRAILDGGTARVLMDTLGPGYTIVGPAGEVLRRRILGSGLLLRTTATRQEVLFTARGTSSLYSTTWVGRADDAGARWHGARVAPTGVVTAL